MHSVFWRSHDASVRDPKGPGPIYFKSHTLLGQTFLFRISVTVFWVFAFGVLEKS